MLEASANIALLGGCTNAFIQPLHAETYSNFACLLVFATPVFQIEMRGNVAFYKTLGTSSDGQTHTFPRVALNGMTLTLTATEEARTVAAQIEAQRRGGC